MKRKQWDDEEGVSPVIAVILMVAITVVLAAVLYVWASSFLQQGDSAPTIAINCTGDGTNYHCTLIKTTQNNDLDDFQYYLKNGGGLTQQFGEIAMQNISGNWHGVDVTWDDDGSADTNQDNDKADRADSAGGAYSDTTQAQIRIDAVQAGNQASGTANQKGEGTISVSFYDNDRNGKFTAGDQFTILGNGATHQADNDYRLEIKYDITDDTIGSFKLGN